MKKFLHIVGKLSDNQIKKERIFLVILITILVLVWFKKGLILGSGESGLPFYNSTKLLAVSKNSWTDMPLGTNSVIGSANYPYYQILSFLETLGIPEFIIQGTLFWLLFVCGVLSIHKMTTLFYGNSALSRVSSSLFYIFNPIVHVSVLHRFQYTLMFFYFFIPLAFLIYLKGLQDRNFVYVVILSLVSVVFAPVFIGVALLEMFFGVLGLLSIFYFITSFNGKKDWFYLFYFLGFLIVFGLIHAWWLSPLILTTSSNLGTAGSLRYFSTLDNIDVFVSISARLKSILSVFRLFPEHAFLREESSWGWVYSSIPFVILSFFSIIAFIIGLFRRRREVIYKFLLIVSLLTMFFMKGSLPPFGDISLYLFRTFTFLHAFRNPFEKIGMLLPFAMAIPVGFGIAMIVSGISNRFRLPRFPVAFLVLFLAFPVFMFPIATGYVFTGGPPPANRSEIGQYVKVPDYYREAREWLDKQSLISRRLENKQDGLFRVLVLPINGEGMTYKWEYGFSGVELSNNLFNQPMISLNSSQAFLPEVVSTIEETLVNYPEKLPRLLALLNIRYVLVRDDIDHLERETEDPKKYLKLFENDLSSHFEPAVQFGKLKFFLLKSAKFAPRIFASNSSVYAIDPSHTNLTLMPFSEGGDDEIYINTSNYTDELPYLGQSKQTLIKGVRVENVKVNSTNPIDELPYVTTFRDSPFYPLVRFKEGVETQFLTQNRLLFQVGLLGKRALELNNSPNDILAIEEYDRFLKSLLDDIKATIPADAGVVNSLLNQKLLLEKIRNETDKKEQIDKIIARLDSLFVDLRVKSIHPSTRDIIYRFYTPKNSEYEILISKEKWDYYFKDKIISDFELDGKNIKIDLALQDGENSSFILGTYLLEKGVHEIGITHPQPLNLIAQDLPLEFDLSSQDTSEVVKTFPILDLDENFDYALSFEYLTQKGNIPFMMINSDTDPIDKKGERIPRFGKFLERDNYDFGWKKYTGRFKPVPSSSKHYLTFKLFPFGDCKGAVARPYRRYCQNVEFNKRFLRKSEAKIRNLKIEKIFQNAAILREVRESVQLPDLPKVDFEQISPARYRVKIAEANSPFFLVLSTTFDHGWNAYFTNNAPPSLLETLSNSTSGDQLPAGNHLLVNGYSNSWYIDKTGSFEMFLEFNQEKVFVIGQKVSILFIIIAIGFLIYRRVNDRYINS